jgi:hypothetical protein
MCAEFMLWMQEIYEQTCDTGNEICGGQETGLTGVEFVTVGDFDIADYIKA